MESTLDVRISADYHQLLNMPQTLENRRDATHQNRATGLLATGAISDGRAAAVPTAELPQRTGAQ